MRNKLVFLVLIMALGAPWPTQGKTPYMPEEALKAEASKGFEDILDLWREGNYAALYERTISGGSETREGFAKKLADAPLRPACCWEKIQELEVTVKDDSRVILRAKLGFEGESATLFKTRSFKLEKGKQGWQVSRADILSLAGTGKKKARHKKGAAKGDSH